MADEPKGILSRLLTETWPAKAAGGILDALMLPGQVAGGILNVQPSRPGYWSDEDEARSQLTNQTMMNRATDLGGLMMLGGTAGAQPGAAGIFGGRLAKGADQAALSKAEDMAAKGASREQIWSDTGWFQGGDGKWRFEINDASSRMNPNIYGNGGPVPATQQSGPAASQLWHKDLYHNYPDLRRDTITVRPGDVRGSYYGGTEMDSAGNVLRRLPGDVSVTAQTVPQARSVALHELQHAIQYMEGFAPGANFSTVGRAAYQAAPGEIEARNVQRRIFMNADERRARPPWLDDAP